MMKGGLMMKGGCGSTIQMKGAILLKLGVFGPHISQFRSCNYHKTQNFQADFRYCLGFERALWDLHTSWALNQLSRKLNELVHAQVLERRHSSTPRPSPWRKYVATTTDWPIYIAVSAAHTHTALRTLRRRVYQLGYSITTVAIDTQTGGS